MNRYPLWKYIVIATALLLAALALALPQDLSAEATYYTVDHLPVPEGALLEVGYWLARRRQAVRHRARQSRYAAPPCACAPAGGRATARGAGSRGRPAGQPQQQRKRGPSDNCTFIQLFEQDPCCVYRA